MYCRNCGKQLVDNPEFCQYCGTRLIDTGPTGGISEKSRLAVTLLSILPPNLGVNGIHRFYLGKIGTGIAMLLTLGGLGIWTLIDFIYAVSGNMKDKDGKLIKNWD